MKLFEYRDDSFQFNWTIEYNLNAITFFDGLVKCAITEVININSVLPLASVVFKKMPAGHFKYELTFKDGRQWKQKITFDSPNDPLMTFNSVDIFRVSEFILQRALRDCFCAMQLQFDLSEITCTYV